jgi:hypothetical protein
MERKNIIWLILVSVIIAVIISFTVPVLVKVPHAGAGQVPNQPPQGEGSRQPSQEPPPPPGQQDKINLKTLISFINIGLIIPLFIIYTGIYRKIRTSFTLGLMAVIFSLGMYAVTSNPLIMSLLGGRSGDIGVLQIIPDLCATVALIILIRISHE